MTIILPNGYAAKLTSKYSCLCLQISTAVSLLQRSFSMFQTVVNAEIHNEVPRIGNRACYWLLA